MTQDEYLKHEIALWGEEYIFDLVDRGYTLKLTTAGWKWLLPAAVPTGTSVQEVDTDRSLCYAAPVGAV